MWACLSECSGRWKGALHGTGHMSQSAANARRSRIFDCPCNPASPNCNDRLQRSVWTERARGSRAPTASAISQDYALWICVRRTGLNIAQFRCEMSKNVMPNATRNVILMLHPRYPNTPRSLKHSQASGVPSRWYVLVPYAVLSYVMGDSSCKVFSVRGNLGH